MPWRNIRGDMVEPESSGIQEFREGKFKLRMEGCIRMNQEEERIL